jgi:predicted RNase H-like nuclease
MRGLGIDGCRTGWIAVSFDTDGKREPPRVVTKIETAIALGADRILIDIPIGLPDTKRRDCDLKAREMLGTARSRVFLDVRRPLLRYLADNDYAEANRWAKDDGAGISRQLWGILPKIDEVDRIMRPEFQSRIREGHPELSFMRLNGRQAVSHNKKTPEGAKARAELLVQAGFADLDEWVTRLRGTGASRDDLFDACALALSAIDPHRVECKQEKDARGLSMDMWY